MIVKINNDGQIKFVKISVKDNILINFWEKKEGLFGRKSNGAGNLMKKAEIWSLWSTAAGDKEVEWLQKTNLGFQNRRIHFWGNLRPFPFS